MNIKQWTADNRPALRDILLISVLGAALRAVVYLVYATMSGNDTPGYIKLAQVLRDWNFDLYDGYRTPGYSLFLLALGIHLELVRAAQHVLGILTAILIYLTVNLRATRKWALAAGLLYGLSIHFIFFEASILTEALSNFLVMLIFFLFARRVATADYSLGRATFIGLLCAYLTMVRPQYLPILFIVFFFDAIRIIRHGQETLRRLVRLAPGLGILFASVGGWVLLNRILLGSYLLTLFSASALMQHSIRFGEKAGPEWREAGAILVKHREARPTKR